MRSLWALTLSTLVFALAWRPGAAAAWEVRLRHDVAIQAAIVRLADVADLVGDDVPSGSDVAQIPVSLGPTPTRSRELTASDVRRTLTLRGVDVRQCQFTGASRVVVAYGQEPLPAVAEPVAAAPVSAVRSSATTLSKRPAAPQATTVVAERRLEAIVAEQLQQLAGDDSPWKATVRLVGRPPAELLDEETRVTVGLLKEAREGKHQLVAHVFRGRETVRVPFEAEVQKLLPVVVLVRALVRGEVIRAEDVELQFVDEVQTAGPALERVEDAVGREVRQGLSANQPLSTRSLQQPLLVRKRDDVEVLVRCGGVTARRNAVALGDGTRGDMIVVDTNDGSKTQFNARVVGIRQVEVLPNTTSVGE